MKDASLFPFKSRSECYLCYEKVTGTKLHAFREKLNLQKLRIPVPKTWKCKNCGTNYSEWSGHCDSCGKWNTIRASNFSSKPVRTNAFTSELDHKYVMQYLKSKVATRQPIKIYYKDDATFRVFYNYKFDNKYLHIPSTEGYDYKYLIDKIRNVE